MSRQVSLEDYVRAERDRVAGTSRGFSGQGIGQDSQDMLGMFIRGERRRTESSEVSSYDRRDVSIERHLVHQPVHIPQQGLEMFQREPLRRGDEKPEIEVKLSEIYQKASRDQSLNSAQRIDSLVRGVKLELSRIGMRPEEIRKQLTDHVERLIKEKRWTLTYSEALEEGTMANESELTLKDDSPFYCSFCELKYHPAGIKCKICHSEFLLRIDLEAHVFVDHKITVDGAFQCPYCYESFPGDPKMFRDHIYTRHFCADDHLECPYGCKMLVLKSIPSEKHYKTYHMCVVCGDKISRDTKYHMDRFHAEKDEVQILDVKPSSSFQGESRMRSSQDDLIKRAKEVLDGTQINSDDSNRRLVPNNWNRNRIEELMPPAIAMPVSTQHIRCPQSNDFYSENEINRPRKSAVTEFYQEVSRPLSAKNESVARTEKSKSVAFENFDMEKEALNWKICKDCGLKTPSGGYVCQLCNEKGFQYKVELNVHIKNAHGYPTPSFELNCEICRAIAPSNEELMRHIFATTHRCKSDHLVCPEDPKCTFFLSDEADLERHLNEVHNKKKQPEPLVVRADLIEISPERDPNYSFELAPRIKNESMQSVLNISKTRNKHAKISVDFPPESVLEQMEPRRRLELVDAGFLYCAKCPLMYHPTLSGCGRCTLKFIFPQAVMEHMVNVHDVPEIYSEKRCPFCREFSSSYTDFLNHIVGHFCDEHSECEFGCTKLVVGGPKDVVKHALDFHSSDSPAKPVPDTAKELFKSLKEPTAKRKPKIVPMGENEAVKSKAIQMCLDCNYQPGLNETPLTCSRCPGRTLYAFASKGDLMIHEELVHSIKASESDKVLCSFCSAESGKKGSNRKFNGDGLNQHRKQTHSCCPREHFRCKQCQIIVPHHKQTLHMVQKHGKSDSSSSLVKIAKPPPGPEIVDDDNGNADDDTKGGNMNKRLECTERGWKHCKFCPYSICYSITYTCQVCELTYFTEVDLDFHLATMHNDDSIESFVCSCGYTTKKFSLWNDHRKEEHGTCAEHIACRNKKCTWLFPNKKELLHHYQMNACKIDSQNLITATARQCSACKAVVANESFVSCLLCTPLQKYFPTVTDFATHLNLAHKRFITGTFKCPVCPKVSLDVGGLKKHLTSDHAFCSSGHALCAKRSDCSVLLQDSAVNIITHACVPLKAEQSSKIFKVLGAKGTKGCYRCVKCHLGFDEITILECPECPITFLSRIELAGHLKIDHDKACASAFPCSFCNSSFPGLPDKLLLHRLNVHQHCPFHKYEFGRISILNATVQPKALAEGLRKADVKMYVCPTCNRDVRSFDKLHPPRQCPICPFNPGFYAESEFVVHMQSAHKLLMNLSVESVKCYQGKCAFIAGSALDFVDHRAKAHQMCITHLVCPMYYCRRVFPSLQLFLNHIISCDGVKPKVILDGHTQLKALEGTFEMIVRPFFHYKCDKCPFNIATSLFFKCKLCENDDHHNTIMPFFVGQMFLLHLINRHSFVEPKEQFQCQYCSLVTFSGSLVELKDHMKNSHNICVRHFLCGGNCLTLYPRMRKFQTGHKDKTKCGKYPIQLFENAQFSFDIVTTCDELSESVFKTRQRLNKFKSFTGMPALTDARGNTTLKSIFTATASMLPTELLEETKQKLKQELVRDKKRQEKKANQIGKLPERSRTPSRRRSRTPKRRSRSRSSSRLRIRKGRRSRSKSRSLSRRRRPLSRSRSSSRRRRRKASKSKSRSRKRSRSRSLSSPRRRRRRLPSKSRSISKPRDEWNRKRSKSRSSSKSRRRSRSDSKERRSITQRVISNSPKRSRTFTSKPGDEKPKETKVKIASAGDGVESKSLSTLMNEYSEPHSLSTLAASYSKDKSPPGGIDGSQITLEEAEKDFEENVEIQDNDPARPSQWEDVMSNMLNYTDELMVRNSDVVSQGNEVSDEEGAFQIEDRDVNFEFEGDNFLMDVRNEMESADEENYDESYFEVGVDEDELLLDDTELDGEL